jgi:hypothetical protein
VPKIKYKELANALRQDLGQDAANIDDVSLVQAWVADNPQYKNDVIFDDQVVGPAKRTGNLLEDLKTAEPLPRTKAAFQRERGGLEVPFVTQQFGFQGGEMVQPARPEIDESSLETPFVQVDNEPVISRGVELLPTVFSNTLEGQKILDFTKGKKDVKSILDYYTSVAQEGALGSESDFAKASLLKNSLDANLKFAEEQYNDLYPDAPISWEDFLAKSSDPQFQQDREILGQELTSLFGKMKYYEAMGDEQSYSQTRQSAEQIKNQYESLFGDFEQVLQVASPFLEQFDQYGQELNQLNEKVNKEAKEIEETSFFGKTALAASRFVAGGGYLLADLAGAVGATDIADKMKSGLMDSQLSTKDPRMALFKAPYDSKQGGFVNGGLFSTNTLGFVFEQGLNMIPSIAAAMTPYGRLGQLAVGTIGTSAMTYDEYAADIDQAALQVGAKVDPQTRAILSAIGAAKTGLIENAIPINKFFKTGMSKAFSEAAVRSLASGKSLDFAIKAGIQGLKSFSLTSGVEVAEEILDQGAQDVINQSIVNQFPDLAGQPQFEPQTLQSYGDIAVNTLIAVAPLGGTSFAYSGSRLKEDLFHNVARSGKVDVTLDLFEENKDKFKDSQYKKNVDRLSLIGDIYDQIPENIDDVSARKIADKMLEIESINSKMSKNTPQAIRERNTAKIDKINQEISSIFSEAEMSRPAVTEAPEEAFPTIELQIPESDQNVLNAVSERIEPIIAPLVQRMTNAEEIDMAEIEAVAEQMIDEQSRILESESLSETERQNLSDLIESQIDNLLNYEFATTTITEQAGQGIEVKGVVRAAKPGLPQKISAERFHGATITDPKTGEKRIVVLRRVPITQSRSGLVYQLAPKSFSGKLLSSPESQQVVSEEESKSTPFSNMEYVSSVFDDAGRFMGVVLRDAKTGEEIQLDNAFVPGARSTQGETMGWNDLALDIAIAESQRQIGTVPEGAFIQTIQRVVPVEQVRKIFPNLRETGTAPEAAGVQPQTEQDVRQETNVTQERGDEGEASSRLPQEEGRQEGQVTPAVEGEAQASPTAKKKKTAQERADEQKATLEKLKETLKSLKAKPGGKTNIDLTFGVVPITKAVWNTAIDTAILAIDAGQTIAQAVKAASDYISSQIQGDWGKGKFESYMNDQFAPTTQPDVLKDVESTAKALEGVDVRNVSNKLDLEQTIPVGIVDKIPRGETFQERLSPEYFNELKQDIKENGIKQPIILRHYAKDNALRLFEGHHRLKIAKELGIENVPIQINVVWGRSIKEGNEDIVGQKIYNPPTKINEEYYAKRQYAPSNILVEELGFKNKEISEAYHKAKKDGSNPELVKAVEDLLVGEQQQEKPTTQPESQGKYEYVELPPDPRFPTGEYLADEDDEIMQMRMMGQNPAKPSYITRGDVDFGDGKKVRLIMAKQGNSAIIANITTSKRGVSQSEFLNAVRAWLEKNKDVDRVGGHRITGLTKGSWRIISRERFFRGASSEIKPENPVAESRREFREKARKYFDGLKKLGFAYDPERNAKEDIAFLKALKDYIKLEIDNGMVTFKGFIEKTANLIEGFNEKGTVSAAKKMWAEEIVKAYPKIYSKLQKAKKELLDKEIQEARVTLQNNLKELLSGKKIFRKISSLTTERKLDELSSDILVGMREEIEALGGLKKLSNEDLLFYNEMATQAYKEGQVIQSELINALKAKKEADKKNAKSAITNQEERSVVKLKDANEAREFLSKNKGNNSNQVNINNGQIIADSVEEFDILSSMFDEQTTFGGTTTAPNPNSVKRGKGSYYRTTVGGGLIYLLDKLKGKTPSQETINYFNDLIDQVKSTTFRKKRLNAELNNDRTSNISFLFKNRFAYTRRMLSTPRINGEKLVINDQNGSEIKNLSINHVLFFYQLMKDPHFLKGVKKGDGKIARKIGLEEQSMRDIIDFVNLEENDDLRELMSNDQVLIKRAAQNAANVMEANNISSEMLNPRPLNLSAYENDKFIGEILNKIYNNSVPTEIEYFPSSVESDTNDQTPDVDALLGEDLGGKTVSAMSRFMIEREVGGTVKVKSYDAQLGEYFESMSNTAAKLPILKRFQAIFNKENTDLISSYYGKNTTNELKENIARYIVGRPQDAWLSKTISEGVLGKWLSLGLGIQMFLNLATAFSQLASSPGPILAYGVGNYLNGLSMLISGETDFKDSLLSLSSGKLFRERLGSRIDAAAIVKSIPSDERGYAAYFNEFNKKLISFGSAASSYFDAASILLSLPIYAREYSNARRTMTDQEAKDYAEEKIMDLAELFLQTRNEEMISSAESRYRTTLYSFATIVPQLHRQAIMAAKRIQRKEGDVKQNLSVLAWSAIGSSVAFRLLRPYFESIFEGDDEDEELKNLRSDKRTKRVALDLTVDATKSFGLYGAVSSAILKTGYQLVEAEEDASKVRMALDITPEIIESIPSVSIKLRNINDAIKSYYDDENLKGTTQGIQALTGLPIEKARMFAVQMSDGFLSDQFSMAEKVARISGFISENKAKEKLFQKAMSTDPLLREKLSPSEIQRFTTKQKNEYKSATSIIARQYSEATTESEREAAISRLISLQSGATKYDNAEELVNQIQDDFDKKVYENMLPKEFLEIKKMPSTKKVNFVANEFNATKNEQEAIDYLETLSAYGVISDNEKSEIVEILLKSNKAK